MKLFKCIIFTFFVFFLLSQAVVAAQEPSLALNQDEIKTLNEAYEELQKENIEAVRKLFDEERDLIEKLSRLFIAANQGNFDAVKEFIESGGNVNIFPTNGSQMSFLLYAITKNDLEMVKYLAEKGADVNHLHHVNRNDIITPLSMALRIAGFSQSFDIIDYLRAQGAKMPKEIISNDKNVK